MPMGLGATGFHRIRPSRDPLPPQCVSPTHTAQPCSPQLRACAATLRSTQLKLFSSSRSSTSGNLDLGNKDFHSKDTIQEQHRKGGFVQLQDIHNLSFQDVPGVVYFKYTDRDGGGGGTIVFNQYKDDGLCRDHMASSDLRLEISGHMVDAAVDGRHGQKD